MMTATRRSYLCTVFINTMCNMQDRKFDGQTVEYMYIILIGILERDIQYRSEPRTNISFVMSLLWRAKHDMTAVQNKCVIGKST